MSRLFPRSAPARVAIGAILGVLATVSLPLAVGYQGRRAIILSQRDTCRSTVAVWASQKTAALLIAADPFQSRKTREARGNEAAALAVAIWREAGTPVDCVRAHPGPSLLP